MYILLREFMDHKNSQIFLTGLFMFCFDDCIKYPI